MLVSFLAWKEKMFDSCHANVDKLSRDCYKSNIQTKSNDWAMEMFESVGLVSYTLVIIATELLQSEREEYGYRT